MPPPAPLYLQLYPTFRCNQRCTFCFNGAMPVPGGSPDMSYEDALRLLSLCAAHGIPEIDIMGGEPLLLAWMPDFFKEAIEHGMRVNVSTNGSLPDIIGGLQGINPDLLTVGISVEGSTRQRHGRLTGAGHFDDTLTSLSLLLDAGLDPLVKTVVNRETMKDIPSIVALIAGLGIRRYVLIHMDVLAGSPAQRELCLSYPDFLKFFREISSAFPDVGIDKVAASCFDRGSLPGEARCAGGVLKLAVAPDGSAYPCNLFLGVEEFRLGNLFEGGLESAWNDRRLDFFRKKGDNLCPKLLCANRANCTGGCPAHGYYHSGDPGMPDIRCTASG